MEAIAHENRWFRVYMIYREITVSLMVISNSKLLCTVLHEQKTHPLSYSTEAYPAKTRGKKEIYFGLCLDMFRVWDHSIPYFCPFMTSSQ